MIRPADPNLPIAVIGSGLGGLAAAATLAARGYHVEVFEQNPWLGGKAAVLEADGFRFDMGPTILTVPKVLSRVFEEAGRVMADYLDLRRLDPQWRCFFTDGSLLDLREDMADMQESFNRLSARTSAPGSRECQALKQGYEDFIKYTERLHRISDDFFFWKAIGGLKDMFDASNTFNLNTLSDVLSMRMGSSVARTIRSYVDDPRVAQMLDHFTQYVGSSPYQSPAILCSIASMQVNEGVWYPIGGTRAVPEALIKLGQELGVTYHTDAGVRRIAHQGNRATAIELESGDTREVAAIVSNSDSVRTRHELLDGEAPDGIAEPGDPEPACSGVVLYLGLNKRYDHLAHHGFVFSDDPHKEFHYIYEKGEPAPDPTAYIAAPSNSEPGVAPEGGEALYVLVHTPYLRPHHDWSPDGPLFQNYRDTILDKLETTGGMTGIRDRIAVERHLTPQDIHDRYRVLNGAIYGLASHGTFTGAFKPSNRNPVRGLYLCGGSAHPGPGMPMVMMSGWIAADTLDQDGVVGKREAANAAS